jgi:hypothetical protein
MTARLAVLVSERYISSPFPEFILTLLCENVYGAKIVRILFHCGHLIADPDDTWYHEDEG